MQRVAAGKATDVKIDEVTFAYEEHRYRTPLKFGGTLTDRVTILNVHCVVSSKNGKSARGFGSMPMGNVWSWPSRVLSYDQTLDAMKALAGPRPRHHGRAQAVRASDRSDVDARRAVPAPRRATSRARGRCPSRSRSCAR